MNSQKGKLILASGSPRRRELLSLITDDFLIIPAEQDERLDTEIEPAEAVKKLAEQKAEEVSCKYPQSIVIGADTTVFFGDQPLGKPKDTADAKRMLDLLSGKKHTVITAVAIAEAGKIKKAFAEQTEVEFFPLTEEEKESYAESGEPMDKAGGYGIQGKGALLISKINGDYYNVMGFPVARVYRELKDIL